MINGNVDTSIKSIIIDKINTNCLEILQNPFGNYIIQHIFDVSLNYKIKTWNLDTCKEIFKVILNNISSLSMQKFSSNVIEKCLDIVDSVRNFLIIPLRIYEKKC